MGGVQGPYRAPSGMHEVWVFKFQDKAGLIGGDCSVFHRAGHCTGLDNLSFAMNLSALCNLNIMHRKVCNKTIKLDPKTFNLRAAIPFVLCVHLLRHVF